MATLFRYACTLFFLIFGLGICYLSVSVIEPFLSGWYLEGITVTSSGIASPEKEKELIKSAYRGFAVVNFLAFSAYFFGYLFIDLALTKLIKSKKGKNNRNRLLSWILPDRNDVRSFFFWPLFIFFFLANYLIRL